MQPLSGTTVLDFTTLLPGPLATLLLAEAGAEVIKVERPEGGDPLRGQPPAGAPFSLLNRGKRSVSIDLKTPGAFARLRPLLERADVLVEQFRPGVMERLGLGPERLRAINRGLVYCSITGYGQDGPDAHEAGHDLNYLARAGVLGLAADANGDPPVPPVLAADVAGGAWPAVFNVLLALRERDRTGTGGHVDVAMAEGVLPFLFRALAAGEVTGRWPAPGGDLLTGGSPRYRVYRTADGRHLAVAALEQRFWDVFCERIGLDSGLRDDARDPAATGAAVAEIVAARTAARWRAAFAGADACACVVATAEEACSDPHFAARGVFARRVEGEGVSLTALPVPVAPAFRADALTRAAPALGEANAELLSAREDAG